MEEQTDTDLVRAVFERALQRMEEGRKKYGSFNQATDTRRLVTKEAMEEILDACIYIAMQIIKIEAETRAWRTSWET